jgi:hypothetical protein
MHSSSSVNDCHDAPKEVIKMSLQLCSYAMSRHTVNASKQGKQKMPGKSYPARSQDYQQPKKAYGTDFVQSFPPRRRLDTTSISNREKTTKSRVGQKQSEQEPSSPAQGLPVKAHMRASLYYYGNTGYARHDPM